MRKNVGVYPVYVMTGLLWCGVYVRDKMTIDVGVWEIKKLNVVVGVTG
jgi:hypothetical protein